MVFQKLLSNDAAKIIGELKTYSRDDNLITVVVFFFFILSAIAYNLQKTIFPEYSNDNDFTKI